MRLNQTLGILMAQKTRSGIVSLLPNLTTWFLDWPNVCVAIDTITLNPEGQ